MEENIGSNSDHLQHETSFDICFRNMNYDLVHPVEKVLLKVKFMWCKIEHVIPIVLLDSKVCLSPSLLFYS